MNEKDKKTEIIKYHLGLDVGISSVGWGIIGEKSGEYWLEDFGVRLFQVPEDPQNKKSWAEKRREFRGKRRLLDRWNCRREDLKKFFVRIFGNNFLQEFEIFIERKKSTNLLEGKIDETKFFNPYVVRYRALSSKIELVELFYILLHISKYRGYRTFYLDDNLQEIEKFRQEIIELENNSEKQKELVEKRKKLKELEKKDENKAVAETEKLFRENNYRSVAEMVVKNEKFRQFDKNKNERNKNLLGAHNRKPKKGLESKKEVKKNLRNFVFPRELLEEEVQKILEKQSEYYPQLKDSFEYKLYESGELKEKKTSAQKIIKAIIFRQRDFEEGPGPRDQEKKVQWKGSLKEIHHRPIEKTRGYCQYFPTEQRGWRCSLIYCLFQFINAFSEIRINFSSSEKGKEREQRATLHKEVIDWLLSDSDSGYKPVEKKKLKTQLKDFLKVKNINYSTISEKKGKKKKDIEENINFKVDFLDYLKTLKSEKNGYFYSALWKNCSSQFYLNYEIYEKTVFYRIGKIIFENITEKRRKKALNELSQTKYSLESFQNCLTKLEKYDKERSPASVSFAYMIETIKAFLEGERYGEFQSKKKEDLLKKLKSSKSDGKWSPWMHPDLVRNPVVFRSFNQTRKILKNLLDQKSKYNQGFATINVETGRDLWNSEEERNRIERKNRDKFKEKEEIKKRLEENLDIQPVNETDILKYRLWEDQNEKLWVMKNKKTKSGNWKKYWDRKTSIQETKDGGVCLYCGVEINVYDLKVREKFQKEHIIPQSKWANDSFNNLVLSHRKCNDEKGDRLPSQWLHGEKWESFLDRVDKLYQTRNKEKHKFLTLGKSWETELEDFISRNINDTRIIATRLIEYISKNKKFPETKVQSVKGSTTSYFRKQIFDRDSVFHYKEQLRSLTPYHHAIDAIILAHFKSQGHIQLLEDLTKINRGKWKLKRRYITDEQFNSLSQEIINRWKRPKRELKKYKLFDEYTFPNSLDGKKKNAIEILEEETKQKEIINDSVISPISSLKNIVETRIPVQLEKSKDWDEKDNKKIQEIVIEIKGVLSEEKYNERIKNNLKDKKGNIHYPYISYASEHKIKEVFIASEQAGYRKKGEKILSDLCEKLKKNEKVDLLKNVSLSKLVEKIGLEKLNSEYGSKYNFLVVKDKREKNNYTIWDTSKYDAGFGIKNDGKTERIKNIDLLLKKKNGNRKWLIKNYRQVIRPYDIFTLSYPENSKSELVRLNNLPLIYTGTKGQTGTKYYSISAKVVGLIKDNKEENLQIIYPEHGDKIIKVKNNVNSWGMEISIEKVALSIKLLKIDILGKREK